MPTPEQLAALMGSLRLADLAQSLIQYSIGVHVAAQETTPINPADLRSKQALVAKALEQGLYVPAEHHKYLASKLEAVEAGRVRRLLVLMPPQHGKSTLASQLFISWYLGRNPRKRAMLLGHSQNLVDGFGEKIRAHITSPRYSAIFPGVTLSPTSKAKANFRLCVGGQPAGEFNAFGVGGGATGRGAELIVIDDIIKNREQADSPAHQEKIREWLRSVALTRQGKDAAIVGVMTRWGVKDPAAWMLAELAHENWEVVALPAIAESIDDPLGRTPGEALWPERYSLKQLRQTEATMGKADWASLYQQNPAANSSIVFDPSLFRRYTPPAPTLPTDLDHAIQSWDLSFGANNATSSWVVGQVWVPIRNSALEGGWAYYLLRQFRAQLGFTETRNLIVEVSAAFPKSTVLIENKANGPGVIEALGEMGIPNRVKAVDPGNSSKTDRAYQVLPLVERGVVFLPDPESEPSVKPLLRELEAFPMGVSDDCVDALTQALNHLKRRPTMGMSVCQWEGLGTYAAHQALNRYAPGNNARLNGASWG